VAPDAAGHHRLAVQHDQRQWSVALRTTALLVLFLCLAAGLPQARAAAVKVDVLSPDAAMRTFPARLEGTYKGKPTPSPTFVTAITMRQDGQWKERFSDHRSAALAPLSRDLRMR
jgi:hypothetical protein